ADGRVKTTLGAELDARGRARLSASAQDLEVRGSAIAGASARAEAKFGVNLLGVAISQKATGEAWAGAGARGAVGVHRTEDRLEWRLGWGAVLGLGAAAEWEGAVDVAKVPARHRRLAAATLRAGLASTPIGPAIGPLLQLRPR
ncbi:MAG: hypothetical protein JWM86_662, partial [Thermoleophilia bacterium]|nr:hypothetical protein [Thermoleophilia bacterium]